MCAGPGLLPLNLYVLSNTTVQHFFTTAGQQGNALAMAAGYKLLGPQGYVPTESTSDTDLPLQVYV